MSLAHASSVEASARREKGGHAFVWAVRPTWTFLARSALHWWRVRRLVLTSGTWRRFSHQAVMAIGADCLPDIDMIIKSAGEVFTSAVRLHEGRAIARLPHFHGHVSLANLVHLSIAWAILSLQSKGIQADGRVDLPYCRCKAWRWQFGMNSARRRAVVRHRAWTRARPR